MNSRKKIIPLSVLAILLLLASTVSAATLTVGTDSVIADQTAQITVEVDVATGIAGAAFTIQYDTTALELTAIESTFFDTFAQQWDGLTNPPDPLPPNDVTVDSQTYDRPLIRNDITTPLTGTRIAAARAMPADDTNKVLFTLSFLHKNPSSVTVDTTYDVQVVSTSLNNTDAGYDAGGETIPMLVASDLNITDLTDPAAFPVVLDPAGSTPAGVVGSVVNGGATFEPFSGCTDTDADGVCDDQDDFPNDAAASVDTDDDGDPDEWNAGKTQGDSTTGLVLDADDDDDGYPDPSDPNSLVPDAPGGTGYDPASDTRTYDISGSVSYSGSQTGTLFVKVYEDADMTNEIGTTSFANPIFDQAYTITGLPAKSTYYLQAFIDVSEGTAGIPDSTEAKGSIVVDIGVTMAGSDITIIEIAESIFFEGPSSLLISSQDTFVLKTEVPAGETLKAYNIKINYDSNLLSLVSTNNLPAFPPTNVNTNTPGEVIINSFNTTGVAGPAMFGILEFVFAGKSLTGSTQLTITVNSYGEDGTNQFPPQPQVFNLELVDFARGDADGSGAVDIFDALIVAEYDAFLKTQSDLPGFAATDVDSSGLVDIFDALKIAEFDAGLIPNLD